MDPNEANVAFSLVKDLSASALTTTMDVAGKARRNETLSDSK